MVRVVPDQTGVTRAFDYLVPEGWPSPAVGDRVRIALGPRRVGAWVVAVGVEPPPSVPLRPLAKHSGHGPPAELVELAGWAQWRWAAKSPVPFLRTASPHRVVTALPAPGRSVRPGDVEPWLAGVLEPGVHVVRLPPATSPVTAVLAACSLGDALVVCATRPVARHVARGLAAAGIDVAAHPEGWSAGAAGGRTVVGTRAAAWAPVASPAAVVVVDEHDEALQEEGSPTWHARDVCVERARRAGVPCVLVSPAPTLDALRLGPLLRPGREEERSGWPIVDVVDRREADLGREGLFSPQLVRAVESGARVLCVLNQRGRVALLACRSCGDLARCERCDGALSRPAAASELVCGRCGVTRPVVCAHCGSVALKAVRLGVARVRDDLEALAGEPVVAVTADTPEGDVEAARLHVGTEAVLHRVRSTDLVAFLDLDQELLAPRYRAAEQALGLVVRAARLLRGRRSGGRLLLQTRLPEHEVVRAAVLGDPSRVAAAELARRELLGFPPFAALAEVGDQAAAAFIDRLGAPAGVEVLGPTGGSWLLRAPDHRSLCDVLAAADRPAGRLRLAVDPPRI